MASRTKSALQPISAPVAGARTLRARSLVATPVPAPVPAPLGPASPVIKWVGGKTKLLHELVARAPTSYARYLEPFVGGGALFFRLAPTRAILGDGNADLTNMYRQLATDPTGVIRQLRIYKKGHSEAQYYETRARWNDATVSWTPATRAAAFIYLNKTCFNGLWRVNKAGHFNVPMGRYADPSIFHEDALMAAGQVLARADIRTGDFRTVAAQARAGDFVYFDPPYDPLTPTANFTSYTADVFGVVEQEALADLAARLTKQGAFVMLSNHDTPRIRALYKGFVIDRVQCPRAINSNAQKRGAVPEVVITSRR